MIILLLRSYFAEVSPTKTMKLMLTNLLALLSTSSPLAYAESESSPHNGINKVPDTQHRDANITSSSSILLRGALMNSKGSAIIRGAEKGASKHHAVSAWQHYNRAASPIHPSFIMSRQHHDAWNTLGCGLKQLHDRIQLKPSNLYWIIF